MTLRKITLNPKKQAAFQNWFPPIFSTTTTDPLSSFSLNRESWWYQGTRLPANSDTSQWISMLCSWLPLFLRRDWFQPKSWIAIEVLSLLLSLYVAVLMIWFLLQELIFFLYLSLCIYPCFSFFLFLQEPDFGFLYLLLQCYSISMWISDFFIKNSYNVLHSYC